MLTAVWVAVVAFVIGVGVAVYVMFKAARLMTESSAAIASVREKEELLIERAGATIDRAGEQIARTETITASMDGVTASMADVTASMTELRGRITALTAAAPPAPDGRRALTWTAALTYGLARALGLRWAALLWPRHRHPAQVSLQPRHPAQDSPRPRHPARDRLSGPGDQEAVAGLARRALADRARPAPVTGRPLAALTGRRRAAAVGRQNGRQGKVFP